MKSVDKRIEALEAVAPAEGPVLVVRFIGTLDDLDPDIRSARAGEVELTRNADETEEAFIERAEAVAMLSRQPSSAAIVVCWPD